MYVQRVVIHPHPVKVANVRALLTARVKRTQAAGQRVGMSELVVGRNAPEFQVTLVFEDLSAFEALRKRNQADATFRAFGVKLASMTREPVGVELSEVVVPIQPAAAPPRRAGARARRAAK